MTTRTNPSIINSIIIILFTNQTTTSLMLSTLWTFKTLTLRRNNPSVITIGSLQIQTNSNLLRYLNKYIANFFTTIYSFHSIAFIGLFYYRSDNNKQHCNYYWAFHFISFIFLSKIYCCKNKTSAYRSIFNYKVCVFL